MSNRLKLNFQIDSAQDRNIFLNKYIEAEIFKKKPLTKEELETCANYILWGKDQDGLNSVQKKEIEIKTKNGTWDKREDESLDSLIEDPAFNEANLVQPGAIPIKNSREVFSRVKAIRSAPDFLVPIYHELFYNIDKTELLINLYDLKHEKRKNPPREELINKFSGSEIEEIQEQVETLTQYNYLKLRHYLVELRRQQFTYKDTYSSTIQRHTAAPIQEIKKLDFGEDIKVLPLGENNNSYYAQLFFRSEISPLDYSEKELQKISNFLWQPPSCNQLYFDFENIEHVYNLFLFFFELQDSSISEEVESGTFALLKTLEYYMQKADFTEIQKEILNMKINKVKNQNIANYINKKYNKSYSANYISTIFKQKIIKRINDAAAEHKEIFQNIFFEENFKKCCCCGKTLLRNTNNFVKKSRAKDGLTGRCKKCDKIARSK